jgi:hypothetical protein
MFWMIYLQGKNIQNPLDRKVGWDGCDGKEKFLNPCLRQYNKCQT